MGCVSPYYFNYNPAANTDDGHGIRLFMAVDQSAFNYNPAANTDFGGLLCVDIIEGCMDSSAINYNSAANTDDGSYPVYLRLYRFCRFEL